MAETSEARPVGRPTDYDAAFCERVVDLGAEGMGRAEIAHELGVCRQTIANWEKLYPDFLDAMTRAGDASLAWWERQGREGLANRDFNAGLYGKCMGGRFPNEPYRERVQLTGKNDGPIEFAGLSDEEIESRIAALAEGVRAPEPQA